MNRKAFRHRARLSDAPAWLTLISPSPFLSPCFPYAQATPTSRSATLSPSPPLVSRLVLTLSSHTRRWLTLVCSPLSSLSPPLPSPPHTLRRVLFHERGRRRRAGWDGRVPPRRLHGPRDRAVRVVRYRPRLRGIPVRRQQQHRLVHRLARPVRRLRSEQGEWS